MAKSLGAGLAYFLLIFLAGMVLGTIRILLLEPRMGEVASTLLELPVMLALAWLVCGWLIRRFELLSAARDRALMGIVAFVLLMAAELALSLYAVGGSVEGHFAAYQRTAPMLGLLGQLAYAVFPLLRSRPGEAFALPPSEG